MDLRNRIQLLSLPISVIHICINTYMDSMIFEISGHENKYFVFKMISCAVIFLLWNELFYVIKSWKEISYEMKRWIYFSVVYFAINFLLLLIIWPGIWRWDDLGVLTLFVRNFDICYWQSLLHSIMYLISLAVFPFAAGIVIVQVFIISAIVGYISKRIYMIWENRAYFFIAIFALPAILTNNLYPMRSTLYAYTTLLLLSKIILDCNQCKNLTISDAVIIGILTGVVATWRTEGIIFLFAVPVYYIIFFRKQIKKSVILILCFITLISAGGLTILQNQGTEDNRYLITAFQVPLGELIKGDFNTNSREQDLNTIDKVLSVNMLMENNGTYVFWNGGLKQTDKESIIDAVKVYVKLVLMNLPKFLYERINFFAAANGMTDGITTLGDTTLLFQYDEASAEYSNIIKSIFCKEYPFVRLGSEKLRADTIKILECRTMNAYNEYNFLNIIFYNVLPVVLSVFIILFNEIRKKKYINLYWIAVYFINVGIVIATVPETLFMYYFPHYVVGIGFLFFMVKNKVVSGENVIFRKR